MLSSGSESAADIPDTEPSAFLNPRSSTRRKTTNPRYNLNEMLLDDDEENKEASSHDSDDGYDPIKDYEKEKAAQEKRGRPQKVGRLGVDGEEA